MDVEVFKRLQQMYWVLAPKGGRANWHCWLFDKQKPEDIGGSKLEWRRPTMAEAVQRQLVSNLNPHLFTKKCLLFSRRMRMVHYGREYDSMAGGG